MTTRNSGSRDGTAAQITVTRKVSIQSEKKLSIPFLHKPKAPPDPLPFDFDDGLKRLELFLGKGSSFHHQYLEIQPEMTVQEARFWVEVFTRPEFFEPRRVPTRTEIEAACLKPLENWEEFVSNRIQPYLNYPKVWGMALFKLFPVEDLLKPLEPPHASDGPRFRNALSFGFRYGLLPYLDKKSFEELQSLLRRTLLAAPVRVKPNERPPLCLVMANAIAPDNEIRSVTQQWLDQLADVIEPTTYSWFSMIRELVLLLEKPDLILHYFRRFNLSLTSKDEIAAWLAHIGLDGFDVVEKSILTQATLTSPGTQEICTLLTNSVIAPELAPFLFRLYQAAISSAIARNWFKKHPVETIAGLVEMIESEDPLSEEVALFLIDFGSDEHAEVLSHFVSIASPVVKTTLDSMKQTSQETHPAFTDETTPDWLRNCLSSGNPVEKLPDWFNFPRELPKLVVDGHSLNRRQVIRLVSMLRKVTVENYRTSLKQPFWQELVQKLDRGQFNGFLTDIFETWQKFDPNGKDVWVMLALGMGGDDFSAKKLIELLKWWSDRGKDSYDAAGLEALRAIGTPLALTYIQYEAHRPGQGRLSEKAMKVYKSIANEKGISVPELDNRIIPDCGLDADGGRDFDYGPRKLRLTVSENFKPVISNGYGVFKRKLPKAVKKDDPELTARAFRDWEMAKEQIRLIRETQPGRFEQAMCRRETWTVKSMNRYLIPHPVVGKLVRRLVWGLFSGEGMCLGTFRIAEDRTFSDFTDRLVTLPPEGLIGPVHPALMSEEQRLSWLKLFNDYFITQPFPQLSRPVARLQPEEELESKISRFKGLGTATGAFNKALSDRQWWTGTYGEWPMETIHYKYFEWANLSAVITFSLRNGSSIAGFISEKAIHECFFIPGRSPEIQGQGPKPKVPLNRVDPIVISEVLSDLTVVASKGK